MLRTVVAGSNPRPIDADEIRDALAVLMEPGQTFEIRALPSARFAVCRSADDAIRAAESFSGDAGSYYTLNPCRPDMTARANNKDILSRRWLLVDVDPIRPTGASATEPEKLAALEVISKIREHLTQRFDWPVPVVIDSGNGWHLLYRVELPNTALSQQLIKGVLVELAERFDDALAMVDRSVHNASRISKLPGTWACKGADTADRPHRMARLISVPKVVEVVTAEQLQAVAGVPPTRQQVKSAGLRSTATDGPGLVSYVQRAVDAEIARMAMALPNSRHTTLTIAAFNLGQLCGWPEFPPTAKQALYQTAVGTGLPEIEVRKTLDDCWGAGCDQPRDRPEQPAAQRKTPIPNADTTETIGDSGRKYKFPLIVRGSTVTPKRVRWLMQDRIPYGFLTLMAGRTGIGKSFVTMDLAARISTGGLIPLDESECFTQGNVLIISEDSHEYMLAPRLIEAGADMGRVAFMSWEAMSNFNLDDTQMLNDVFLASGSPVLVVIDPPTNFIDGRDEHRNSEVRSVLMGIAIWAGRHDIAVVLITHCNKGGKKDMAALDRIIGSVAWASTSRIAHLFGQHPDEKGKCVWKPLKSNLGKVADGLVYSVESAPEAATARVMWHGAWDGDEDDLASGKKKSRGVVATEWLVDRFRERREWFSDELRRAAMEAGISKNALWAPEVLALPIRKRQGSDANGEPRWRWIAEPGWPPDAGIRESGNLVTEPVTRQTESQVPDGTEESGTWDYGSPDAESRFPDSQDSRGCMSRESGNEAAIDRVKLPDGWMRFDGNRGGK